MNTSASVLEGLLDDLAAESDALRRAVASSHDWGAPTPAPGWSIADQIGHLTWTDEAAVTAASDHEAWDRLVAEAMTSIETFIDDEAHRLAALPRSVLLDRWDRGRAALGTALRETPADRKLPWFGPPMSATSMATARFMETWAHGLDVYAALGLEPEITDRIRPVAHLGARTRDFSYTVQGLTPPAEEFRIELVAPSGGTWVWGPESATQRVSGPAAHFCLLVTQRIHRDDTALVAEGQDAAHWLTIAQAFAGPAGVGRARR